MQSKTKGKSLFVFALIFSIIAVSAIADVVFAMPLLNDVFANNNIQTYIAEDNTTHTIQWAKGVDAPKMLSKGETAKEGDRVFKKQFKNMLFPLQEKIRK